MPLVFEDEDGNVHESLHAVFEELPLFGHLYLNMQAQNIALTDIDLREMEGSLLREYIQMERTPLMSAMRVSAWSQMWVFAFYELMRTWRQRAKEVRDYASALQKSADPEGTKAEFREKFARAAQLSRTAEVFDLHPFEEAEDAPAEMIGRIERASEIVEPLFRRLEAIRMTLAKHEVPKTRGMPATAPGYGRIDLSTGSIYWMIDYKDGTSDIISRRGLADELSELLPLLRIEDRI
ncbi:MAG TPA: hypothetical protein VGB79_12930 [Allosphingosinicella sp.]|jgi:hypothetical protein